MQSFLIESAIRATLIAAVVALVLWAMRIKTAYVRHAVWAGVVAVMLLLPAWVAWGPKAPLPVLPVRGSAAIVPPEPLPSPPTVALAERPSVDSANPIRQDGGYYVIYAIYFFGAGVLLLRLAIGTIRANRLKSCITPITVGVIRPRIILPECAKDWPRAQLDAVLAHEGEHVRRHDPLFQWLALFNRAIFWFHPLAWWLERKLSGLAEEACDAAVLAQGHDPREYSRYLLDLARTVRGTGMRVGMAMPGVMLPQRIRQMLSGIPAPRISRPRIACAVAVCAGAAAIFGTSSLVRAQSKQTAQAFEVTSVKPFKGDPRDMRGPQYLPGGKFTSKAPLLMVLASAYNVPFQPSVAAARISGGPAWINLSAESTYDIEATAAKGAIPDGLSPIARYERMRLMVQTLLADRFKLVVHHETKEMPVYALVVGKGGPKLPKSDIAEKDCPDIPASEPAANAVCHRFTGGRGRGLHARAVDMSDLVNFVQAWTDRPLFDKTGIKGLYKIETEPFQPMELGATAAAGTQQDGVDLRDLPTLFTVFERLGLRMESQKGNVDTYVIDHIEKPSEN